MKWCLDAEIMESSCWVPKMMSEVHTEIQVSQWETLKKKKNYTVQSKTKGVACLVKGPFCSMTMPVHTFS